MPKKRKAPRRATGGKKGGNSRPAKAASTGKAPKGRREKKGNTGQSTVSETGDATEAPVADVATHPGTEPGTEVLGKRKRAPPIRLDL